MVNGVPVIARSVPLTVTPRVFGISTRPLSVKLCVRSVPATASYSSEMQIGQRLQLRRVALAGRDAA